jgi:hypothetical protein
VQGSMRRHSAAPKFALPKMEVPAAFREFAEKGVSQAKESYEKLKEGAEQTTDVMETTYVNASNGKGSNVFLFVISGR